jgi:hypothetical protein
VFVRSNLSIQCVGTDTGMMEDIWWGSDRLDVIYERREGKGFIFGGLPSMHISQDDKDGQYL